MTVLNDPQVPLRNFVRRNDFFIGIDSEDAYSTRWR